MSEADRRNPRSIEQGGYEVVPMMNKVLEGMARVDWDHHMARDHWDHHYSISYEEGCVNKEEWERGMRKVLLWLADHFDAQPYDPMDLWSPNRVTATTLRKAAGDDKK